MRLARAREIKLNTPAQRTRSAYAISHVRVEPDRNALIAGGETVRVEPKVMDVLCELADAGGDVVSRDELINRIWGVEFGGDESVSRAVSLLRKALKEAGLGDGAIETLSKRGYRLTIPVAAAAPNSETETAATEHEPAQPRFGWRAIAALAGLLILAASIALFTSTRNAGADPAEPPVVAVLPFDDLSPSGDYVWFAEGLADELINTLARVPEIVVIGRRSSFLFHGSDLGASEIGDRLGARYLIEGSVRRDGGRLRISVTLIDTKDQATVWSESYDRPSENVFDVQTDLARSIVIALNARMTGLYYAEKSGTKNPAAFDAYLMGRAFMRAEGADNILRATNEFRRATELDPDYLDAWLGLEAVLTIHDFWHPDKLKEARAERDAAIDHALQLAPNNDGILNTKAWIDAENNDIIGASRLFTRLFKGQPKGGCNSATQLDIFFYGRIHPSFAECLIPRSDINPTDLSLAEDNQLVSHMLERFDIAEIEYERSKDIPGGPGVGELYAFLRAFNANDRDAARAHFRTFIDFMPAQIAQFDAVYDHFFDDARVRDILNEARIDPANQDPTRLVMIAKLLAIYDDPEGAADTLRRHFLEAGGTWWQELWMPEHAETRRQSAFKEVIRGKGFEAYFRQDDRWNDFCRPLTETDFECF